MTDLVVVEKLEEWEKLKGMVLGQRVISDHQ